MAENNPDELVPVTHKSQSGDGLVPGLVSREWLDNYGKATGWSEVKPATTEKKAS